MPFCSFHHKSKTRKCHVPRKDLSPHLAHHLGHTRSCTAWGKGGRWPRARVSPCARARCVLGPATWLQHFCLFLPLSRSHSLPQELLTSEFSKSLLYVKTPGKGPVTWPGREPLARKGWGGHPRVSPVRVLQATRQVLCMCAPKSARRKVSRGPSFFRLIRPWNKRPCPQVASLAAPRTRSETSRAVHHPVPSPTP